MSRHASSSARPVNRSADISQQNQSGNSAAPSTNASRLAAQFSASKRSRSAGNVSRTAFGRTMSAPAPWVCETSTHPARPPAPTKVVQTNTVTVDELNAIDYIQVGGNCGSVRLEYCNPQGSQRALGKYIPPYELREAVTISLENGLLTISKVVKGTGSPPPPVASILTDQLASTTLTESGLRFSGKNGFEASLTIHHQKKRILLYKILAARTRGVLPTVPEQQQEEEPTNVSNENDTEQPCPEDRLPEPQPRSMNGVTPSKPASPPKMTSSLLSLYAHPPSSARKEADSEAQAQSTQARNRDEDRDDRRKALYAQLHAIRSKHKAN